MTTVMSAAATAALGPKLFAAQTTSVRLAIGIAPLDGGALLDAASVPSSDGSFISRDARVSFSANNTRRAAELTANFTYLEGSQKRVAPFRAWARGGNRVNFNMPVASEQKLAFSVITDTATLPVTLSLLSDRNALKLVRGVYVLVPLYDKDVPPKWSGYDIRDVAGRSTLLERRSGQAASFEHFVLRIDYAT